MRRNIAGFGAPFDRVLRESEHNTVDSERSVHEAIVALLDADDKLDETARDLVLSAPADISDLMISQGS